MKSINLELKTCDGSANPYLALAGLITAGLDGVARGLTPPAPAEHDPMLLSPEEALASDIRPLPSTQLAALEALEKDELLVDALGELMLRCLLATRRAENAKAEQNGDEWARLATFSTF